MDENQINSIKKTSIALSRNTPVALVVGAAGFLGSHLTDKLLNMGIQVIGVDNFSTGEKRNLEEAIKQKGFHLILEDAGKTDLDLARLDYLFVVAGERWDVSSLLQLFRKHQARCLFVSSIDLYDEKKVSQDLKWYKQTESRIAKFAHEQNLNARILRLGPVFGPRMRFAGNDPIEDLIKDALLDRLQKEESSHFSSRSLFIEDAIELLVKCIFSGATALKIFDGVLPTPLKVSDVKQILLDPVWHEQRGFKPQELPPWPTPNLEKTVQILNWKPKTDLVSSLRKTLSYFKDNEIKVSEKVLDERKQIGEFEEEKKQELEALTRGEKEEKVKREKARKISLPKVKWSVLAVWAAIFFIIYALIVPFFSLFWGTLTFRNQLSLASENLEQGEFDASLQSIGLAQAGYDQARFVLQSFEPLRKLGIFQAQFELGDDLKNLANYSLTAANSTVAGVAELYLGLKAVTGEISDDAYSHFQTAQIELTEAFNNLERANALLSDEQFQTSIPSFLQGRVDSLEQKLSSYSNLVAKARSASLLLPEVVAKEGSKSYLVLLQNNMELRPTGGFIGSYAKITFEGGKLKKLEVNDIYTIDGQLTLDVEPPKEIKEDLGQSRWFLRDSNWEPDFPTSARQAEWFYTKETGEKVLGVIAVDVSAMESLLEATGPLQLADYDETITQENLFQKAVTYAEQSFFAGSQAKKSFLTSLTNELFNKIFFLPKPNWPGIVQSLGKSLESKHISLFLDDPKLFSYLVSEGWSGALPRASEKKGEYADFLAPVEANLGANKANYYLDRRYDLETVVGKEGEIRHRLRIAYTNSSPSDTFPAGRYKNRMRVYLPFGSRLVRVLWGETNITKDVTSFVDFGRSGISMLLQLEPKMVKTLILDIEGPQKLQFTEGKAIYKMDIIKQAGTLNDPFEWKLTYPINMQIVSTQTEKIGPQELNISTDLSKDRSFEVVFEK